MVHFPDAHTIYGWAKPQPAARNTIQVSHMSGRHPTTSAIPLPPKVCISRKLETATVWDFNPGSQVSDTRVPTRVLTSMKIPSNQQNFKISVFKQQSFIVHSSEASKSKVKVMVFLATLFPTGTQLSPWSIFTC